METGLCPRCGSRVWFFLDMPAPYCNECGWNLDELYKGRHKHDRTFRWVVLRSRDAHFCAGHHS